MTMTTTLKCALATATICLSAASFATTGAWTIEDVLEASSATAQKLSSNHADAPEVSVHLLVSLSMPKASLERLAADAKMAGITLSFRGVPKAEETHGVSQGNQRIPLLNAASLAPFEELIQKGAGVELNPELFREAGVTEVPALVLKENRAASDGCGEAARTLIVPGDVTLGFALDRLLDRDDAFGEKARELRSRLGNRP